MSTATTHFHPPGSHVGDVIPFAHDGEVWLYYLLDERRGVPPQQRATGMPWAAVTTRDFAHFTDHGIVLPSGGRGAGDFDCYTGSVVADDDGRLHLFYTGHNPAIRTPAGDVQVVCHATSDGDPASWTKHPEWTFGALDGYSPEDWRDPFVFRAAAGGPWQMLLATRRADRPGRRSGVVARLVSDDLVHWRDAAPLWDPHRFITQECPDLFQWGRWWYLVYSEFSDSFQTRYRIAESPDGPWLAPEQDTIDGRAFYAAKSVAVRDARYFIGWIATRDGGRDDGAWQWAGDMAVLQAHQRPDGSLGFGLPDAVRALYRPVSGSATFDPLHGAHRRPGAGAADRYAAWIGPDVAAEALLTVDLDIHEGTQACGVLLRSSDDGEDAYALRLEPLRNRLVLDRWPRGSTGPEQWQARGDVPHAVELERPVALDAGRHRLEIYLDHTLCVAVVDGGVALSARLYDRPTGRVGLFAVDGGFDLASFEVGVRRP
ncbi:MAG TPA: GH32 C-terminal domain-containing protein [Propionibacteriaceae bacterium]|nr:GH32 C-terminal domain-containing protein [Propionibacteriaceae bacterium]